MLRQRLVTRVPVFCVIALANAACGTGPGSSDASDALSLTSDGNEMNGESGETMSGDGDPGDGDPGDGDPGDGDPGDGDPGDGDPGDGDDDDDEGEGGSMTKWDLAPLPDGSSQCGTGSGGGDPEFSYLWAANSGQGTISKIDTMTVVELGRYQVRPDGAGSPSRTSVSLSGHVAVASRSGGVTKFYATEENCQESNGMPGIQTSQNNVALPWDQEECRAWHIPFPYSSQRPVAWAPGEWNTGSCSWENEKLWTAGRIGNSQGDEVVLIDGDDGVILETIPIPGLKPDSFGIYGAAVDSEGNFWGTGWADGNHLVHVDIDTLQATVYPGPSSTGMGSHWYGMTVDVDGYVWNCASRVARFDPIEESWTVSGELPSWSAGCMADAEEEGLLWLGTSGTGITAIDRVTMQVVHQWPTPTSYGVSVDFEGYVWAVNGNGAHKVDPETGQVWSYNGLVGAYTYSDMTGAALSAVGNPSG
jgi:hypothetical protein